jgi:hypothetical protein
MTTTLGSHIWLVEAVRHAGGTTIPTDWDTVRARYTALQHHGSPMTDRLARAAADPNDGSDLDTLYAAAVAEHWPMAR